MYLTYANKEQLNVAIGDYVSVQGNEGVVTEVHHGYAMDRNNDKWGRRAYVDVKVSFFDDYLKNTQYDNSFYGLFHVIKKGGK